MQGRRLVRVEIDRDRCVGAAMCVSVDAERFEIGPDGKAAYIGQSFDADLAEEAAELCPQAAITLVYEGEP